MVFEYLFQYFTFISLDSVPDFHLVLTRNYVSWNLVSIVFDVSM